MGSISKESDINLSITQKLGKLFEAGGFEVIYTRTKDICLADEHSPSFKLDDMKKRREIIQGNNIDMLISIHCNKFNLSYCRGAQVFYQNNSENGKVFCDIMTSELQKNLVEARTFGLPGDFYVLNSTDKPAIIVECGYVSNPEEEKLLLSDEYQSKIAYSIYSGAIKYILHASD